MLPRCDDTRTCVRYTGSVSQGSLLLASGPERVSLAHGAWVEYTARWLGDTADLFDTLIGGVAWEHEQRVMYDRLVDVPRLHRFYEPDEALPHPALHDARNRLNSRYGAELGEPFASVGLCLYRDGRDSVAWHGDRIGRSRTQDTMVAILSLGDTRSLALRPNGGGRSIGYPLFDGDLLVMGGSCQRTWDHAVHKSTRPCGPRISVQFRVQGVR